VLCAVCCLLSGGGRTAARQVRRASAPLAHAERERERDCLQQSGCSTHSSASVREFTASKPAALSLSHTVTANFTGSHRDRDWPPSFFSRRAKIHTNWPAKSNPLGPTWPSPITRSLAHLLARSPTRSLPAAGEKAWHHCARTSRTTSAVHCQNCISSIQLAGRQASQKQASSPLASSAASGVRVCALPLSACAPSETRPLSPPPPPPQAGSKGCRIITTHTSNHGQA